MTSNRPTESRAAPRASRAADLRLVKTSALHDPFITAGDRSYLIGAQDGGFPDMGWHVEGEMGGLWSHPIKVLDGFWLRIDDRWLGPAGRFISAPWWNAQEYDCPGGLAVTRAQYVPDGEPALVVRYTFRSPTPRRLALRFLARTDLQDVWAGARPRHTGGPDTASYLPDLAAWLCRDGRNPWYLLVGSRAGIPEGYECGHDLWGPERTRGDGISVALDYSLAVPAGEEARLEIIVAGSEDGEESTRQSFQRVRAGADTLQQEKAARYDALLELTTLDAPDPSLTRAWDWLKCNYDWLVREVPGVGRGLGAGAADYVWWFGCDNAYALLGALALGQHQLAIDTLDLLRTLSLAANGPKGRVIHEANTRGHATNRGCAQETPHFVSTAWQVFRWTGDLAFLRRNYDFCRRGLLEWTLGTPVAEGDLLPPGYGITEREGLDLQCVDTAAHTASALWALAGMAGVMGDSAVAERCRALRRAILPAIEEAFWREDEGLYGDMLATPAQMVPRLRSWIAHARAAGLPAAAESLSLLLRQAESDPEPDCKRAWLLEHWVIVAPLEAGLTEPQRAARVLDRLEGPEFIGPWGMYLSGIERTWAMSINTGVLAVTELRYGRADQALAHLRLLTDTLEMHMPGAISEISPDGGCFVQAWSGYAVAWPIVAHLFGLEPDAHEKRLAVNPVFPGEWREARLSRVRIGDATFDFVWKDGCLRVVSSDPTWTVTSTTAPIEVVDG